MGDHSLGARKKRVMNESESNKKNWIRHIERIKTHTQREIERKKHTHTERLRSWKRLKFIAFAKCDVRASNTIHLNALMLDRSNIDKYTRHKSQTFSWCLMRTKLNYSKDFVLYFIVMLIQWLRIMCACVCSAILWHFSVHAVVAVRSHSVSWLSWVPQLFGSGSISRNGWYVQKWSCGYCCLFVALLSPLLRHSSSLHRIISTHNHVCVCVVCWLVSFPHSI